MSDIKVLENADIKEILQIKKIREEYISEYLKKDFHLVSKVTRELNLKKIHEKYISKVRKYDENSYAKKKMREEEIYFILMFFSINKVSSVRAKHADLDQREKDFISNFFKKESDFNKERTIVQIDLEYTKENKSILNEKKVREYIITKLIEYDTDLAKEIINELGILRILDKYIINSRTYTENPYSIKKMKEEEIQFIMVGDSIFESVQKFRTIIQEFKKINSLLLNGDENNVEYIKKLYLETLI